MSAKNPWLQAYSRAFVVAQNAALCMAKSALHKPTSDGYEITKALWEEQHSQPMRLDEAVDLCRRCHRMAPFCFYNGNTFAALIRDVIQQIPLQPVEGFALRSLAGHIVAGVATEEEVKAFREYCDSM